MRIRVRRSGLRFRRLPLQARASSARLSEQNGHRLPRLFKAEHNAHAGHHVAASVEAVPEAGRPHVAVRVLEPVHQHVEQGKDQRAHRRPLDGAVETSLEQIVLDGRRRAALLFPVQLHLFVAQRVHEYGEHHQLCGQGRRYEVLIDAHFFVHQQTSL